MIRFRVNGIPAPQGSKRHVGGGRMVESSRAVGPWREAVRAEAQRALRDAGSMWRATDAEMEAGALMRPCSVTIVFVLPRPGGHYGASKVVTNDDGERIQLPRLLRPGAPAYPAKRPDLDKLERAVLDGLVAGGVMADDSQVCAINSAKVYARNGEAPGALIEVEAL